MTELKHPIVKFRRVCFAPCALMMEYMCFCFLPFRSGSDISITSLQDFLLRLNDQDCFGFEDVVRHAGTEIGKLLISCVTRHISNKLFIIRQVNSDMPIYILNRTNAGKNQMPRAGFQPTTPRSHDRCSNH